MCGPFLSKIAGITPIHAAATLPKRKYEEDMRPVARESCRGVPETFCDNVESRDILTRIVRRTWQFFI